MTEKQFRTVMEADSITGPWRMVHRELRPAGLPAGDFDLVQDPDTGKVYMYFERDHKDIVCIDLNDDYLNVTDRYTTHLPGKGPETREAPACFWRNNKLYLTSSGMTGYFPNPSRVAVSDGPHASFTDLGVLHVNDRTETSFGSQISDIFKVPGKKNLYIALADRWLPEFWEDPQFQSGEMSRLARKGRHAGQPHCGGLSERQPEAAVRHSQLPLLRCPVGALRAAGFREGCQRRRSSVGGVAGPPGEVSRKTDGAARPVCARRADLEYGDRLGRLRRHSLGANQRQFHCPSRCWQSELFELRQWKINYERE